LIDEKSKKILVNQVETQKEKVTARDKLLNNKIDDLDQ